MLLFIWVHLDNVITERVGCTVLVLVVTVVTDIREDSLTLTQIHRLVHKRVCSSTQVEE